MNDTLETLWSSESFVSAIENKDRAAWFAANNATVWPDSKLQRLDELMRGAALLAANRNAVSA